MKPRFRLARLRAGRERAPSQRMSPAALEFIVDCADTDALRALCAAPRPSGIRARCVSQVVLRGNGFGRLWRAQVSVRRGTPASLVAAWLRARFGACETPWQVDGIPVTAGRGPRWLEQCPAGVPAEALSLATRRA